MKHLSLSCILLTVLGLLLVAYSVFSYALTDPNLVITSWSTYWQFQQWMWQTFFLNRSLLTWTYGVLIFCMAVTYMALLKVLPVDQVLSKRKLIGYCLIVAPLLLSYNALSHDVFNYMFNAKMVLQYQANPHYQVALNYPNDEWLRFMHNTHTPAPYGYGWTGLSLIPSILGLEKFLPTWLLFRLSSVISIGLLALVLKKMLQKKKSPWLLVGLHVVFLNPLFLIEVVSNAHNDVWMMVPAMVSLYLVTKDKLSLPRVITSLILLGLSVSIKFGSLALVPLWLCLAFTQLNVIPSTVTRLLKQYWPLAASVLMFIPLLSSRSQQFHPWYLTWVLVWLPLFNWESLTPKVLLSNAILKFQRVWALLVIALSISLLYRYVPWLWAGGFEGDVLSQQKLVTWGGGVLLFFSLLMVNKISTLRREKL